MNDRDLLAIISGCVVSGYLINGRSFSDKVSALSVNIAQSILDEVNHREEAKRRQETKMAEEAKQRETTKLLVDCALCGSNMWATGKDEGSGKSVCGKCKVKDDETEPA